MSSIQPMSLSNSLPISELTGASGGKSKANADDTGKVAQDFESLFASMILKEMRNSLEPGSLFGEDSSDIYGGMFDQFFGKHLSDSGGFGMARMIRESLDRASIDAKHQSPASVGLN